MGRRPREEAMVAKPKVTKHKVAKRKTAKPKAENNRKKKIPEKRTLENNIEDLKRRVEELCGGQMTVGRLDEYPSELPEEVEEGFWKHVVDYEEAPWATHFQQLENAGVSLPPPDSLKDEGTDGKTLGGNPKARLAACVHITDRSSQRPRAIHPSVD